MSLCSIVISILVKLHSLQEKLPAYQSVCFTSRNSNYVLIHLTKGNND